MSYEIHSDSTYPLEYHFRGSRAAMRPLFDTIITRLSQDIDFELKVGKTYIGLIHNLVFAALHIQTKKIIVEFVSRKEFTHERITKTKHFQKYRWAYYVDVSGPSAFDQQLIDWIIGSHE